MIVPVAPVASVAVITVVPAATPVTTPVPATTVAVAVVPEANVTAPNAPTGVIVVVKTAYERVFEVVRRKEKECKKGYSTLSLLEILFKID